MTKLGFRFSFSVASTMFILLLCSTPAALGQGADARAAAIGGVVLSRPLPAFALASAADLLHSDRGDRDDKNKNNGCTVQGRGRDKSSNCTAVPEGGTAIAYLSLIALGCLATGIFRSRQARVREVE